MHNMQKCTHTEDQKMLSGIWGHQKYIMPCTGATRLSKFIKFGTDYLDRGNIQRFLKSQATSKWVALVVYIKRTHTVAHCELQEQKRRTARVRSNWNKPFRTLWSQGTA